MICKLHGFIQANDPSSNLHLNLPFLFAVNFDRRREQCPFVIFSHSKKTSLACRSSLACAFRHCLRINGQEMTIACSLCDIGQYQDESSQLECKNDCEIGFYPNDKACSTECPQNYSGIRDLRICVKDCVYTDGSTSNLPSMSNESKICACGKKPCTVDTGFVCLGVSSLCSQAKTECKLEDISFNAEYCEVITDKCKCSKCTKSSKRFGLCLGITLCYSRRKHTWFSNNHWNSIHILYCQ